ncbi:GreA/GreB family elongation factor [Amycolatopsis cihanbeyliensis]|uniref:Transcription elongation GreA/GreB family factor n=1 Tax=Amycolatopsis cihanbeyliensis TaxID=1128664 RepID=A0A542DRL4_AMYCI|nr:GreA/GreB family elongation factor [Amycolatopsis cihanbeyliensis]TQJ05614.1 transcription elongation GreA/GreB family factor [Amycolatopsis cihanbeyliensis]
MTSTGGLSPTARARLEEELAQLREQRNAAAPRLSEESVGDSADQADMLERAEAAAWMDRRINEIVDMLSGASREEHAIPPGTTVTLRFDDGDEDTLRIVAIAEDVDDDSASVLTLDSPLGRAIVDHQAGDTITYRTPQGEATAEIVELKPPQA